MFFEKTGPVWETLRDLENRLQEAGIDYAIIGGLALNVYKYPRQTVDVDVVDGILGDNKVFGYVVIPLFYLNTITERTLHNLFLGR